MKTEIDKYRPCEDARKYRAQFLTFQEAWDKCPRGGWMLWIAARIGIDLQTLTLAKALCAKTVVHLMKDERSKKALEVAERFGRGEADRAELDAAAAAAAADAADAADAAAYAAAADAAAYAAYAAYAAADADAAYAAAADDAGAGKKNRQITADICREVLTEIVFEKLGVKHIA